MSALGLERRSQVLQLRQLQLQVPTMTAASPASPPEPSKALLKSNDRRDTEAWSAAPSRSSGVESGGSRDLSGLTQKDPIPLSICFTRAS